MFFQLIRFGIVGVIAAAVDVGTLVLLTELFGLPVLLSSAVAFAVSVVVNYLLSMAFVFQSKNESKVKEFVTFVLLAIGGLLLNEFILWVGLAFTEIYYLIIKFLAMLIVPIYNFVTRKIFLEKKTEKPHEQNL